MHYIFSALVLITSFITMIDTARAEINCTLIVDKATSVVLHEDGDCKTRRGAQSTFKIPLALMGFDSGILKDRHHPVWPYDAAYDTNREEERHVTDPARWQKESIVWFSQKLTRTMGMDKFKSYVGMFHYGNQDLSGDAGENNGLTHSWLSSSLQISPSEQITFLSGILNRDYKISADAYDKTIEIIPKFSTNGWTVHGKTGTGFEKNTDGSNNRNRQQGWFVGWAEKNGQQIIFAKFIADDKKENIYAGRRARDIFLKELPSIMTPHNHKK